MSVAGAALPDPAEPRGRTTRWGGPGLALLVLLVGVGLWARVSGLSAEGFADDEVHKWIAANRYLVGEFGVDDLEHPMLMKGLAALVLAVFRGALAPETITRLPSAVAGGLTVWAVALLGRRLFGRATGLLAAALLALSPTVIGYHRIAKEDVLLGLFVVLCLWGLTEAKAAADDGRPGDARRREVWSAVALGGALASKYYLFYAFVPLLTYLWIRRDTAWRVPPRRWLVLIGVALATFLALNWALLRPETPHYILRYFAGDNVGGDRGVSETLLFRGRLYENIAFRLGAPPPWFFASFAAGKLAPATVLLAGAGLVRALWLRTTAHRLLLVWLAVFTVVLDIFTSKYGRFFVSIAPAVLLLAADAAVSGARALARRIARGPGLVAGRASQAAVAAVAVLLVVPEARAAASHAPHYRLYLNVFAGGDHNLDWFLPHCDYWDAGVREAVGWIAARAEPGAEISAEPEWTVRHYAQVAGRADLATSPITRGLACAARRPCYVVVQPGRHYRHNAAALEGLAARAPVHVDEVGGHEAARVYRLAPGEALFPPQAATAPGASTR